ncbi:signal peptide protein, partial [Intrasporangium chromatireducens Q5-1]
PVPAAQATAVDHPAPPRPPRTNPAARPWLDIAGDRYPLLGSLTIIGRDEGADIVVDDAGVSRRHSEIRVTNDGPHLVTSIRDLNSTNGTFVNGDRITSQRLEDGDRITLGRTSATFRAGRR